MVKFPEETALFIMDNKNFISPAKQVEVNDYVSSASLWSLPNLKNLAYNLCVPRPRTLAWAILLNTLPSQENDLYNSLSTHRKLYEDLKRKLSRDPRSAVGDDPLSQNDESLWNQYFCDNELRALILQDVVRTFPDEVFFRDKEIQDIMVRVLFFWARSHSHVGYRQGMHEILATVLFEMYSDRKFAPDLLSDSMEMYLDEEYLEHDSFMIFSAIMKGLEKFYATNDTPAPSGRLPQCDYVHGPNEVVKYLDKVREEHLNVSDPQLAAHLASANITLELFGIRWIRLLFGREFSRRELPQLWSYLFSDGSSLPHLHFVIVAMLVSVRKCLLSSESGSILSRLMRPSAVSVTHVVQMAKHLAQPNEVPRPSEVIVSDGYDRCPQSTNYEILGNNLASSIQSCEGVSLGADVSRELGTLQVLRNTLPSIVNELRRVGGSDQRLARPLADLAQLSSLLTCQNHTFVDVETALEAGESQNTENQSVRRQLVPIRIISGRRQMPNKMAANKMAAVKKEVQLKLFNTTESVSSDFPFDPMRLRTD